MNFVGEIFRKEKPSTLFDLATGEEIGYEVESIQLVKPLEFCRGEWRDVFDLVTDVECYKHARPGVPVVRVRLTYIPSWNEGESTPTDYAMRFCPFCGKGFVFNLIEETEDERRVRFVTQREAFRRAQLRGSDEFRVRVEQLEREMPG